MCTLFSSTGTVHGSASAPGVTQPLPWVSVHAWRDPAPSTVQGLCPA